MNSILPGLFDTDRIRGNIEQMATLKNLDTETIRQERINSVPAKRFGEAEEFGKVAAFLASAHASYITGQNILIDGGAFRSAF